MLVLIGPEFDGTGESYARLAQATGLVAYDLKSRIKPGTWGVVKAFADSSQAAELAESLRALGFTPAVVDRGVVHDPERRIVLVHGITFEDEQLQLLLRDRQMPVPYGALCCIVEGEVQLGRAQNFTPPPSSTSLRAPTMSDLASFREPPSQPGEAFLAADLHFLTVPWIARIDGRHFDFGPDRSGLVATDLEFLLKRIAQRAGDLRIDRAVKTSSVVSFAQQKLGGASWPPPSGKPKEDQRFDPYSRLIGEAERQLRLARRG